jgi:hypothetical protein
MPSVVDFPARGKVTAVSPDRITFAPSGTNYELHLDSGGVKYAGPTDTPVDLVIRVQARKLWTVPSGGGFISPIFGPPRTIQGRVKFVSDKEMVVLAGTHIVVTLPTKEDAFDLVRGDIVEGALVNVVALPGAKFEQVPVESAAR